MKDKLYKTGHKSAYYRLKGFLLGTLFSLAALLACAMPVAITYAISRQETEARADVSASEPSSEEEPPSSSSSEVLSYFAQ